jgi:site-specific recombinase XerD
MRKGQKERLVCLGPRALEALLQYLTFVRLHSRKSESAQNLLLNMQGQPLFVHSVQLMMRRVGTAEDMLVQPLQKNRTS